MEETKLLFLGIEKTELLQNSDLLPHQIFSLRATVKNVSEKHLYSPSLILRLREQDIPELYPEWMNFKYSDGWTRTDHGTPPDPKWVFFYYDLEDLSQGGCASRELRLLRRKTARRESYVLWFTVGAYSDESRTSSSWLNMGWIEWQFEPAHV